MIDLAALANELAKEGAAGRSVGAANSNHSLCAWPVASRQIRTNFRPASGLTWQCHSAKLRIFLRRTNSDVAIISVVLSVIRRPRSDQAKPMRFVLGSHDHVRLINPAMKATAAITMNMKKRIFAMPTALAAMPPKPNTAAMSATIKKMRAYCNM
jgi:hypothetical protein